MRCAVELLAAQVNLGRVPGQATRLEDIAHSLGAIDILYLPIVGHGYTQWKRGGPVVHLSLSRNDGRRRFLLAHECGHLVFDDMLVTDPYRARAEFGLTTDNTDALEWVCNEFANELLIPTEELRESGPELTGLDLLKTSAADLRVSLSALIYRLNRVGRQRTLLNLQVSPSGEWVIADRVGAPGMWQGSVEIHPESQQCLATSVPVDEATPVELMLQTRSRSATVMCEVRLSRRRRNAIALFDTGQLDEDDIYGGAGAPRPRPGGPPAAHPGPTGAHGARPAAADHGDVLPIDLTGAAGPGAGSG